MSNTYILLKDLPDGSMVGDEYAKYGDQYRNERFRKDKCPVIEDAAWFTWQVENNPSWFKLKEQVEEKRIEVGRFSIQKTFGKSLDNVVYEFSCNNPIPTKKYEAVKQAIEMVLNKKDKWDKLNRELDAALESVPTPEPQDSKEKPKPLFVTEDGVSIYNINTTVCKVHKTDLSLELSNASHIKNNKTYNEKVYFIFSNTPIAEEYILMNKPYLSVSDVIGEIKKLCDGTFTEDLSRWTWVLSGRLSPEVLIARLKEKQLANHKINNKQ